MRDSLIVLAWAAAAVGCGGHTASPAGGAASGARPTASVPAGDPTSLRYTAGAARYRVEQSQHIHQEVMGQTTDVDGSSIMVVSANLTSADAGNLAAAFSVDSVTGTSSVPGGQAVLEAMRGKSFRAVYTALGRSSSFNADTSAGAAAGGGEIFREFLPTLPSGTLAAGSTWIDTSNQTQSPGPGMTTRSQSIRQHHIVGWELHDGVRALRITTTGNYTISGSGEAQGQQMQVAGTGIAVVDQFISAAGLYLGGSTADSTNLTVNVITMGMEIPIRQTRRASVTRLP